MDPARRPTGLDLQLVGAEGERAVDHGDEPAVALGDLHPAGPAGPRLAERRGGRLRIEHQLGARAPVARASRQADRRDDAVPGDEQWRKGVGATAAVAALVLGQGGGRVLDPLDGLAEGGEHGEQRLGLGAAAFPGLVDEGDGDAGAPCEGLERSSRRRGSARVRGSRCTPAVGHVAPFPNRSTRNRAPSSGRYTQSGRLASS